MPEIENSPLAHMVREAWQTHADTWSRTFPQTSPHDPDRERARTIHETYLRCIAFELGWSYPTPHTKNPVGTMRSWSIALSAIRTVFDDEARMNDFVDDAVRILLANLRSTCTAPEWRSTVA
jgi:hypothetical protein